MKTTHYKVRHHSEEFDCSDCGEPVDVGDTALLVECDEHGEVDGRRYRFNVCSLFCKRRRLVDFIFNAGTT